MTGIRTFVAIELPAATQDLCRRRQESLRRPIDAAGLGRAVRWSAPAKIHLTLRFLGDTSPGQVAHIHHALDDIGRRSAPFALKTGALGCFPNQRAPSVLWLGVEGDTDALSALQIQVEQVADDAGFAQEQRPYHPHLTIGRIGRQVKRADVRRLGILLGDVRRCQDDNAAECVFPVSAFVHMESQLHPTGAVYSVLHRVELTAGF